MPHTSVAHDCYPRHVATRGACAALPCGLWRPHCGRTNGTRGCYVARTAVEGSGWVPPKVRKPWGSGPIAWRQDLGYSWEPCFYSPSALLEAESRTPRSCFGWSHPTIIHFRLGSEAQVHVNPPRSLPFCQLKSQVVDTCCVKNRSATLGLAMSFHLFTMIYNIIILHNIYIYTWIVYVCI